LPDQDGVDVRLGDLWRERPAALVWLRHYGRIYCRTHAVQLNRAQPEVEAAGASLTLIGQLTPRHAGHFRRRQKIELPVLADEKRASYKAAGAKIATFNELLGPKVVAKGVLTGARTGQRQGRTIGHPAQLGGAMLIAPDGRIAWSHMSNDASDNASPEEILAAVRELS
jgi:peroxiredoxin